MEVPAQAAAPYQLHQVIPAENIMVQPPPTPPTAAQLMVQHLPSTSSQQQQPSTSGVVPRKTPSQQVEEYRLKYLTLKKKCQGIQLGNEKLLNRLYHVRKAVRKLTRERRFLMSKLDEFGDDYKSAQLPVPIEDESVLSLIQSGSALPSTYSPPKEQSTSGTKRSASPTGTGDKPDGIKPPLAVKPPSVSPAGTKRRRSTAQNKGDKEKDPNAPKKPANAFLMFCQQERVSVLEEYSRENPQGEMSHQELTKELAKKWNDLTADEKKLYYTMYEQDKRRYEREMRLYKMSESKTIKATNTTTATISTTTPATKTITTQPATIALPSTMTPSSVTSQMVTNPVITAPSFIQTPAASIVVKQEPLSNNNTMMQSSLGAKQATPMQVTMTTQRTLPAATITLSKPTVPITAAGHHPLVTLTTSPVTTSIIPGATSYIKLSLGQALSLAGNPNVVASPNRNAVAPPNSSAVAPHNPTVVAPHKPTVVASHKPTVVPPPKSSVTAPPKTTSNLATTTKSSIPFTLATKSGGQAAMTTKSRQSGAVTKIGGQASLVTKSSEQTTMATKIGGQSSMGLKSSGHSAATTKIGGQGSMGLKSSGYSAATTKIGGQGSMATKTTSGKTVMVTKSGQTILGIKSSGQAGMTVKIGGQSTMVSKHSGQTIMATKTSGQAAMGTRIGVQATMPTKVGGQATMSTKACGQATTSTKVGGQATIASRLSGQGLSIGGQGMSASAVLSRLAAPGGGRNSGGGLTISTTVPSRVTTTTMQHGGTTTQVNVVKETKKLLTGQKPSTGTQGTSLIKKEPLSKTDDPYHFDD